MVASSTSSSSSLGTGLSSTWTTLISQQLTEEKQVRLNRLTQQSSDLDVKKAIFTDLSSQISDLKSSLGSLWSTNASYVLGGSHATSVTNQTTSGTTFMTATADSTAATGSYTIAMGTNDHLATQNRVSSTTSYSSSSTNLGYSGGFSITLGDKTTQFTVNGSDTLYSLASKINSATYDSGKGVSATVVNNALTIQSVSTGTAYQMTLADDSTGGPLEKLGILKADNKT